MFIFLQNCWWKLDQHKLSFLLSILPLTRLLMLFECITHQKPAVFLLVLQVSNSIGLSINISSLEFNSYRHIKTHFDAPGASNEESLNALAAGLNRKGAAMLFYQTCGMCKNMLPFLFFVESFLINPQHKQFNK